MNFDLTTGNARLDGSKMLNQGVGRCGVFHGTERNAGIFHGIYLKLLFIFYNNSQQEGSSYRYLVLLTYV